MAAANQMNGEIHDGSAATLRFIRVSQREKFALHLGAFSFGNSIKTRRRSDALFVGSSQNLGGRAAWGRVCGRAKLLAGTLRCLRLC